MGNFPIGQHHFNGMDLVPGGAVADSLVTPGIGGQVAPDQTAVSTAGIPGIEQAFFSGGLLHISGTGTGLGPQVHPFRTYFQDLIQPFHKQHQTAAHRDGPIGHTGAPAPGRHRKPFPVGQFQDGGNLFRGPGGRHGLRPVEFPGIRFLVGLVLFQMVRIRPDILLSYNTAQLFQDFSSNGVIGFHASFLPSRAAGPAAATVFMQ